MKYWGPTAIPVTRTRLSERQLEWKNSIVYTRDEKGDPHIMWTSIEPILSDKIKGESKQMSEDNQVNESEEKTIWNVSNSFRGGTHWRPAFLQEEAPTPDDLPDYDDITPEHLYTQKTIEQATKYLQPELLDSFRNMAIASAFYWVQMRLAGLPEHIAEMAIREWHRSELKAGSSRAEYEEGLDNE